MTKLFVSYRRKSWAFTHRLADDLRERLDAEVFVDMDSIDQADFERAIVSHLRTSDAVLLVVSETTFADRIHRDDDWVRREIREALTLGLPLVLVCVEGLLPPAGLPDDIKDVARMQGVNFYPEYFTPAVEKLTDFVTRVSPVQRKTMVGVAASTVTPAIVAATVETPPERPIEGKASLDEALQLLDDGDYNKAIFLLESLRESGFRSRFVDVEALLGQAQHQQQQAERRRVAQLEYDEIAALVKRRFTRDQGLKAFQQWSQDFDDLVAELDTESLHTIQPSPAEPVGANVSGSASPLQTTSVRTLPASLDLLPKPFDWIPIPAGQVTLVENYADKSYFGKKGEKKTFPVTAFDVGKYAVTNAQFALFIKAEGYTQQGWWTNDGWQMREKEGWTEPRYWTDEKWNKADYPVVGVSWYEALAFCHWLSESTGENITLPGEQQWQRAAQGDTDWAYPYGPKFDKNRCNFNTQRTTPVTQYEGKTKGDSPFGVVDMSGNVWEWCLTKYESGEVDIYGTDVRVLRGGSWNLGNVGGLRADFRFGFDPLGGLLYIGFRCVRF